MKDIDFTNSCSNANCICRDCDVMHICPEREHEGESNSSKNEHDFEHKDT